MNVLRKATQEERKFLGVCGGLSRFLDPEMDPIIIRLSTLVLTFLWPPLLLIYFIAAIFLKTHDAPFDREQWIRNYAEKHKVDLNNCIEKEEKVQTKAEVRVHGEKMESEEDIDEALEDAEEKKDAE